jgi:acyl-CoA hydrolase
MNTHSSGECLPWAAKEIQLGNVASKIANGSNIYIGSAASTAEATLQTLVQTSSLQDIQILQMVPGGNLPHLKENPDQFRTRTFYSFSKTPFHQPNNKKNGNGNSNGEDTDEASINNDITSHNESLADYTPMSVSAVPNLLREKQLQVDVAIVKVTEPHKVN